MAELKASEQGKKIIQEARNRIGCKVDDPKWLIEASKILEPERNWEEDSPPYANGVSEGTWKAFLYNTRKKGIATNVFKAYCQVLGVAWKDVVEKKELSTKEIKEVDGDSLSRLIEREKLEQEANKFSALRLASQSTSLREQNPQLLERSVLLAAHAVDIFHSEETDKALRDSLRLIPQTIATIRKEEEGAFRTVAFSPDGLYLATTDSDLARVWRWNGRDYNNVQKFKHETLNIPKQLTGNPFSRFSVDSVFFVDSAYLVTVAHEFFIDDISGYDFGVIWVWELMTGKLCSQVNIPGMVNYDYDTQSKRLISLCCSNDGIHTDQILIWQFYQGNFSILYEVMEQYNIHIVAVSLNSRYIATASKNEVRIIELDSSQVILNISKKEVHDLVFTADCQHIALTVFDLHKNKYDVEIWNIESNNEATRINLTDIVYSSVFSPDDQLIATTGRAKMTQVWEVSTGKEIFRIPHGETAYSLAFIPTLNSYKLASASIYIQIFELENTVQGIPLNHKKRLRERNIICDNKFSPDNKYLATACEDGVVTLWKLITGQQISQITFKYPVRHLAFSSDSTFLGTISNSQAKIWRWETNTEKPILCVESTINIAFTDDSKYVVLQIAHPTHKFQIFEIENCTEVNSFSAREPIKIMHLNSEGQLLTIGASHGTTMIYDIFTGKELKLLPACKFFIGDSNQI